VRNLGCLFIVEESLPFTIAIAIAVNLQWPVAGHEKSSSNEAGNHEAGRYKHGDPGVERDQGAADGDENELGEKFGGSNLGEGRCSTDTGLVIVLFKEEICFEQD
jgi:hypothetical protein